MIKIDEENYIHITRGDCSKNGFNEIPISLDGYTFKSGDKIIFSAIKKKGFTKEEVFIKEFIVEQECDVFNLTFSKEDTLKFSLKNKKQIYWYTVVLNDEITILGFDEDGAKKLYVYPNYEEGI